MPRRSVLVGAAALALGACRRRSPPAPGTVETEPSALPPRGGVWHPESFEAGPDAPDGQRAFLLEPWGASDAPPPASRPLLVALHGRGETERGLDVGANAWPNDYELDKLHRRLLTPPLTAHDLLDMTNDERLAKLNASLAAKPYAGIACACPYTPRLLDESGKGAESFGRFITDQLLPGLRKAVGSTADRRATGIDGVSMGGRHALLVGLSRPDVFGVVGALQPALGVQEAPMISALAKAAMEKAPVQLRLVSSEEDPFLAAVRAASERMRADGVPHELLVIPGTHSYAFNRGPGGVEMLLWHERVQRGLPSP
jgi:iron(III)-salmochelin esterase